MNRKTSTNLTNAPRRAAGYIRVSALMGREGESFLSDTIQREKINAWSSFKSWPVTRWYVDLDVSAFRAGVRRPEFERMMEDARAGLFEMVAVYKLTRFARTTRAAAIALDELEQHGVGLVSVTEDIDTTTAGGKFMRNVLFAMAEFEGERISEEWRNVHAHRRRNGIWHTSRPIFGYRKDGGKIAGVDEAEAAAVRLIYRLRSQHLGYGAIRDELHRQGFTSKSGQEWFAVPTLRNILRNPAYAGLVPDPDGDGYLEAKHPAIVPRDVWETVQRTHRHVAGVGRRHRAALLSGLMVCSSCGYRMIFDSKTSNADHSAYRCVTSRRKGVKCERAMFVRADLADEYVERLFLRRLDPKRMPAGGRIKADRKTAEWQRKAARLRTRAGELTRALDELADQRYMKGTLAADEYDRQFARYSIERAEALEQADELESMAADVRPLDRGVLDVWRDPRTPLPIRQQALRRVIDRIDVHPSPRRGPGQAAMLSQRLKIAWRQ